jgi:hypothetical protein
MDGSHLAEFGVRWLNNVQPLAHNLDAGLLMSASGWLWG